MDTEFPFNETETKLTATKKENVWEVVLSLKVSRSMDGDDWDSRDVHITTLSEELETAVNQAHLSIGTFLQEIHGDLFAYSELEQ